jgi:hypothetical protein
MNRKVRILTWEFAGAVLTGSLIGVVVAVGGREIATPVRPFSLTTNHQAHAVQEPPEPPERAGHDRGAGGGGGGQPHEQAGDATSGSNSGPESRSSGSGSDHGSEDSGSENRGGADDDD